MPFRFYRNVETISMTHPLAGSNSYLMDSFFCSNLMDMRYCRFCCNFLLSIPFEVECVWDWMFQQRAKYFGYKNALDCDVTWLGSARLMQSFESLNLFRIYDLQMHWFWVRMEQMLGLNLIIKCCPLI